MVAFHVLSLTLFFFLLRPFDHLAAAATQSFPLISLPRSPSPSTGRSSLSERMLAAAQPRRNVYAAKYSMALMVSLPVGTPAQDQQMVLDTGSQLSWIHCNTRRQTPQSRGADALSASMTFFNPAVSSSFSPVPCNTLICKPTVPDFSVPTVCNQKKLCSYSYFYADGTLAEGNLVADRLALSPSPLVLGCAAASADDYGILGMNMGRLSVLSQSKITKFSYCIPSRVSRSSPSATGAFLLGDNPNAGTLKYVPLMTFPSSLSRRMPNLDPLAYTVPMRAVRVGAATLNISVSAFRPNAGGSGQTFVDSGSELTYLVDEAYEKVREAVGKVVGTMMKRGFSFGGVADMCFDERSEAVVENRIGGIGLAFDGGVEIAIEPGSVLTDAGDGVKCVAIGRSSMIGSAANIIGNVHQQNLWVEYDLASRRIGFGKADCGKSFVQR